MRIFGVFFGLVFVACGAACAQDPGAMAAMQATQIATQQAQMASQQAQMDAQRASAAATQAAQTAAMNDGVPRASTPRFSVKAGVYAGPQTVLITSRSRHAAIYYTTDGWTPTDRSPRYTAPLKIDATTRLQAIAIAPGELRSLVAAAVYTLPQAPQTAVPVKTDASGLLKEGTVVPLEFSTPVSSKTAKVGDVVALTLTAPIQAAGRTLAQGEASATAVVTDVKHRSVVGTPGYVTFAVTELHAGGVVIPLSGSYTLEGENTFKHQMLVLIPVFGEVKALTTRGADAEIAADTPVMATVAKDTTLSMQ